MSCVGRGKLHVSDLLYRELQTGMVALRRLSGKRSLYFHCIIWNNLSGLKSTHNSSPAAAKKEKKNYQGITCPPGRVFTKVGFFGTPPSGADGGRKSGDTPETPSGAASLDPASKKPTPVKILATPVSSILRCRRSSGGLAPLAHRSSCARCLARVVPGPCLLALQLQVLVGN